ncbi:MAG: hypothetical protein Q8O37_05810 [Sulfuricellaceae bacterium]|nr:hypothetical protein [Sulfuricellaceae bacterium]
MLRPVLRGFIQGQDAGFHRFIKPGNPVTLTAVYVDGQETKSWAGSTGTDASGHAYCKLTLSAPPEDGAKITVAMQQPARCSNTQPTSCKTC